MVDGPMLCEQFQAGQSWRGNDLSAGGYLAADHCEVFGMPAECRTNEYVVRHGYAVELRPHGQWYFFYDIAPAVVFGRAACMSPECVVYGVYRAVHEMRYCVIHDLDERVLHVAGDRIDWIPDEAEHLERFVRGVQQALLSRAELHRAPTPLRAACAALPPARDSALVNATPRARQ